jgi:apolipoprotein D and lipocalin family protein
MKKAIFAALALTACAAPPVNRSPDPPLSVKAVDVDRYIGRWYEIARFENGFEKDCEGVTAQYAKRPDGKISVLNTCREGDPAGKAKVAKGVARVVDLSTNAKLKVSFFGPFEGDYWVLDHADDYSWSLVGEPSGRYLWMLARAPKVDAAVKDDLLERLKKRGYNTQALRWTAQDG